MKALSDQDLLARVLAKTCEYLDHPAVVGHEASFLDHIARDFDAIGAKTHRPDHLCVIELGRPGPVFLAHADRHGAVIDGAGQAVYAVHAFVTDARKQAKLDPEALDELAIRLSGAEVFAYDPQCGGRIAYGEITGVDVDTTRRALLRTAGLPDLPTGTPIALARTLKRGQSGFITGQLDNAAPLAALRVAAELGLGGTIVVTSQEESGHSAEHMLAWAEAGGLKPNTQLVVCDTSPFDDGAAALAGAVVLRRRDATSSFNADQVSKLETAAGSAGAPIIFKDSFIERENDARTRRGEAPKSMGDTELGQVTARSKGRYTGATLQLPTFASPEKRDSTTPRALTAFIRTLLAL